MGLTNRELVKIKMIINIDYDLKGSILDIGGGGEAIIGQVYGDRVTAIDNRQEELDEAPNCCTKLLMDAKKLSFFDGSYDNVTFFLCTDVYVRRNTEKGHFRGYPCSEIRRNNVHLGLRYLLCLSRTFCCRFRYSVYR